MRHTKKQGWVWNKIYFAGEINERDTNYVKTEISLIQQIMREAWLGGGGVISLVFNTDMASQNICTSALFDV